MITAVHGVDYQRMAENLVGIERKRLSVFVLHEPEKPIWLRHTGSLWSIIERVMSFHELCA
jgi:hypothetical protein